MKFVIKRKKFWRGLEPPISLEQADSLLTYLILGVILGGRIGYVFFYNFEYYWAYPFAFCDFGMVECHSMVVF